MMDFLVKESLCFRTIKKLPFGNGITTNSYGNCGLLQIRQKIKKDVEADSLFRVIPSRFYNDVKIISPDDCGTDKCYNNCGGLIYINDKFNNFSPVLVSLHSTYPTIVLTDEDCNFISILSYEAGSGTIIQAIDLITETFGGYFGGYNVSRIICGIFLGACSDCVKECLYSEDSEFNFTNLIAGRLEKHGIRREKIYALTCCCYCNKNNFTPQKNAVFISIKSNW